MSFELIFFFIESNQCNSEGKKSSRHTFTAGSTLNKRDEPKEVSEEDGPLGIFEILNPLEGRKVEIEKRDEANGTGDESKDKGHAKGVSKSNPSHGFGDQIIHPRLDPRAHFMGVFPGQV